MRKDIKCHSTVRKPETIISNLLISNNFLNIGIIITTNLLFDQVLDISSLLVGWSPQWITMAKFIIQIVLVTFLVVLFGEVLPKVYATQYNMRLSLFTSPFISLLDRLFRPLSNLLMKSTSFIEDKYAKKTYKEISNEEVDHVIEMTVGETATKEEKNIFKGIFKFGDITVKQIMRTRLDVSGLEYNWNFTDVKKQVIETGFSRLPVYSESLDEVKGILYAKDLLNYIDEFDFDWHTLIRPAHFVHETKLIKDLLNEFQSKRIHMAIVVDEFGGSSGLVTLEDIMEEIIGDIKDEYDEDDILVKKLDEHNYIFEGKTLINDVCRVMGISTDIFDAARGKSDSLGGMVIELAGNFPSLNETYSFEQYQFTVLELEKRRIKRVKVTVNVVNDDLPYENEE
jgi:Hemolysins and related proteins containing CBS domains